MRYACENQLMMRMKLIYLRTYLHKIYPAFSLIEMGIVLIILGCILSISLPFLNQSFVQKRTESTRQAFETIALSLGIFLANHKRLPCPATPQDPSQEDFGREDPTRCTMPGFVPYKTLGLSPSSIKDGAQRYITYHVQPEFCEAPLVFEITESLLNPLLPILPNVNPTYWSVMPAEPFRILDAYQNPVFDEDILTPPFVLVSHGLYGGDLRFSGVRRPLVHNDPFKIINSDGSKTYIDAPPGEFYDDQIFYKDRFLFARKYAGITNNQI